MHKLFSKILLIAFLSGITYAGDFDNITPANPLTPQVQNSSIAIPLKKATLTQNNIHNQYVIAFDRFIQSNIKPAYNDFKILIETMDYNDYAYMKMAENMAEIGFFNLSELAMSKVEDKTIWEFLKDDIKLYHFPSKKLSKDDEIYLAEVYSNIIYNDQSKEATSELIKNKDLLTKSDYANYITSLGFLKSNEFIEAEKYINKAIEMNQQNINYKKLKAEILSQGKNPQNALKIVDYIKSGKFYSTDYTQKVNSIEQYVLYKSKKNYSEKMYHLGYYYYYENEYAKSVRTLQNALGTKKRLNKDIYSLLSRVYYDSSDYDKAQDNALKALNIKSNDFKALIVLGDLNYRNKDYKTALKQYKEAGTNSLIQQVKIAQTYEQLNKTEKAKEIYEKLIKTYNDCFIAYYKIALLDKTKESAYLKKSVAINMNFKDAWIDLGRIAIEQENFDEAKKYLKIANYIDENDFRYYYYQGLLAKKQGLNGKHYFKKSLILNPEYEAAKKELEI